ncbi:MAG: hypothetical protein RLZZ293_1066 [Pseudomonadota bacterium]|jgi:UDPglucose--hexose-1-phosphate uridylyltransferase
MEQSNLNKLASAIEKLLALAIEQEFINQRDQVFYRNKLFTLCNIVAGEYPLQLIESNSLIEVVELIYSFVDEPCRQQLGLTKDQVLSRIIAEIMPSPSVIELLFDQKAQKSSLGEALTWYYRYSQLSNYIKVAAIAKNQQWVSNTRYGQLQLTINLSKPEKDPHEIAKARELPATNYPKCLLCVENEGFMGNGYAQPARHNHRMLSLNLAHGDYYFQYSPYLYYPEHSIILNKQHQDMLVNQNMLENFISFVDLFPEYMIGSNSDIPIVGGSILTHDHYQAGKHTFPIEFATSLFTHQSNKYPNLIIEYLNWPISTLKLTGNNNDILAYAQQLINQWYNYENLALNIVANDEHGQRHNGITPILRKLGQDQYVLYLMLRNNRVTLQHPEGLFHPHRHLHHIKKENIGLIEAMGLAILPGRLANELEQIKQILSDNNSKLCIDELEPSMHQHLAWIEQLKTQLTKLNGVNLEQFLRDQVAEKFCQVLEDAGVFKLNNDGFQAMINFIYRLD